MLNSVCALLVANQVRGARSLTYGIWHDKSLRKASILFVPNNHLTYVLRPIEESDALVCQSSPDVPEDVTLTQEKPKR